MYFTHPETAPLDKASAEELFETITDASPYKNGCPLRLDLYFVPGANEEACVAHYHKEREARGLYTTQIEEYEKAIEGDDYDPDSTADPPPNWSRGNEGEDQTQQSTKMPGLVPTYIWNDAPRRYHGVIWVCPSKNWKDEKGKGATQQVNFDPIEADEYLKQKDDSEPGVLPPITLWPEKISDEGDPMVGPVGMSMFETGNEREDNGPWRAAINRGWKSWR